MYVTSRLRKLEYIPHPQVGSPLAHMFGTVIAFGKSQTLAPRSLSVRIMHAHTSGSLAQSPILGSGMAL
jgi:hypothetical protein